MQSAYNDTWDVIDNHHHPPYDITLCSWNINGLTAEKLTYDILGCLFKDFDIILLSETWCYRDDTYDLQGYTYINYARSEKHPDAKRMSGGLGLFIRNSILPGIKIGHNYKDVIAWITLKKEFFG